MSNNDALVADYLRRLEAAAAALPADRRAELIEEISAHIAEASSRMPAASIAGARSDLLDVLGRLGDPDDIVQAASDAPAAETPDVPDHADQAAARPAAAILATIRQTAWSPAARRRLTDIAAVVLALGSALVMLALPVPSIAAWAAGIALLWYSPAWRRSDKVLGTLIAPIGIGLAVLLAELRYLWGGVFMPEAWQTSGVYAFTRLAEAVLAISAGIFVAVRLLRYAARTAS